MKKLEKLKLNQISKAEMGKREMNFISGGTDDDNSCNCGCGGSSTTMDNRDANAVYGYQDSPGDGGGTVTCDCGWQTMQTTRGGF